MARRADHASGNYVRAEGREFVRLKLPAALRAQLEQEAQRRRQSLHGTVLALVGRGLARVTVVSPGPCDTSIGLALPPAFYDHLHERAAQAGVSMSELMRLAIRQALAE
jgi:hypothetical protein